MPSNAQALMEPDPDRWYVLGIAHDLSGFAHPGGGQLLEIARGRDATHLCVSSHAAPPERLVARLSSFARPDEKRWDPAAKYASEEARMAVLSDPVVAASKWALRRYLAASKLGRL